MGIAQVSLIRETLSKVYESEEEWSLAAKMLAGIPLESGIRVLDDNYKVEKYIQIAMLFLQVASASQGPTRRARPLPARSRRTRSL